MHEMRAFWTRERQWTERQSGRRFIIGKENDMGKMTGEIRFLKVWQVMLAVLVLSGVFRLEVHAETETYEGVTYNYTYYNN